MYVKRLEVDRFKQPKYDLESNSYLMEWRDLVMMIEGIQEKTKQRLQREGRAQGVPCSIACFFEQKCMFVA